LKAPEKLVGHVVSLIRDIDHFGGTWRAGQQLIPTAMISPGVYNAVFKSGWSACCLRLDQFSIPDELLKRLNDEG
jgi:hypothetical protein